MVITVGVELYLWSNGPLTGDFPCLHVCTYWLVGGGWSTCSRTCIPYWWSDIPMSEQRCDSSKIIRVHYLVAQKGTCPTTTTLAATKMRYRLIPSLLSPLGHISPPRLTRPSKPKFCRYGVYIFDRPASFHFQDSQVRLLLQSEECGLNVWALAIL